MLSSEMPLTESEKEAHRADGDLVREFVLGLPPGFDLFYFCTVVLSYEDLDPFVHGSLCEYLMHPRYGRFRDVTIPRAWFKSSVCTVGYSMLRSIKNPDIKILIAMNTADNAEKNVNTIRDHWMGNGVLRRAFPELVPDTRKCRWSNACAEIKRNKAAGEGTYESIGSGGAVISRHYDLIIEDDLVYPKKDDLTNVECFPTAEDVGKAIGWHKLTGSLFSDPNKSEVLNVGTRWAVHDLKDYIHRHEKKYTRFFLTAEKLDAEGNPTGVPVWPGRFGVSALKELKESQGAVMYATQYLNMPRDTSEQIFFPDMLKWWKYEHELPLLLSSTTYVDLAGWEREGCDSVVLTVSRDDKNHLWLRRVDAGRFTPTQVLELMEEHAFAFDSFVKVEEVQYQKAIRHFAIKRMEENGRAYNIGGLPRDQRAGAKDLRIRTLEPIVRAGFLHVKEGMERFAEQLVDYSGGKRQGKVDMIDVLGYETQLRLTQVPSRVEVSGKVNPLSLEGMIEDILKGKRGDGDIFNVQRGRNG